MNRIDREIKLLLEMSAAGELPAYPQNTAENSFYAAETVCAGLTEYSSDEITVLEQRLKALWADNAQLKNCIPVILAAVEKSRGREDSAVVHTELYNYSM